MKSVISFPDRGKWGDAGWRGNCSGHVINEIIYHFKPSLFVDVCEGGKTSREVCKARGVEYRGFDLHSGTDFTADYIRNLLSRPADVVFSHPPYASMIDYTKIGTFAKPSLKERDTSACVSVEEFLEKSRIMLLNQREATREKGVYCSLVGDMRRDGKFRSFQADFISMMPKSELLSVVIKQQHNCLSDSKQYAGSFIPILHEYLVLWRRSDRTLVQVTVEGLQGIKEQIAATWRTLLRMVLMKLGGKAALSDIYQMVEEEAAPMFERYASAGNWRAKVRQQLQFHFEAVQRGVWSLPQAA